MDPFQVGGAGVAILAAAGTAYTKTFSPIVRVQTAYKEAEENNKASHENLQLIGQCSSDAKEIADAQDQSMGMFRSMADIRYMQQELKNASFFEKYISLDYRCRTLDGEILTLRDVEWQVSRDKADVVATSTKAKRYAMPRAETQPTDRAPPEPQTGPSNQFALDPTGNDFDHDLEAGLRCPRKP